MLDLLKFNITARNKSRGAFDGVKKDLKGVKGMMASISTQASRMGRNMRKVGTGLSAGITAPLAYAGKQMVTLYDQQIQSEKTVATAIASTGGAAGKTLGQLKGLASGLQDVSTYGDEDILRNVTAPLLTFTKIQGDTFDRAQANVLDYATLLKMDLKSASLQVGKALNDPIKGVSALSKAGVQFTDSQKGMIKSLVETGDVAGAQNIILKELETQFKGQAAAAASAPLGQWKQLSNSIGDVKEQLGEQIVPFLKPLVDNVKAGVQWFGKLSPEVKRNIVMFGGLAAAVGPIIGVLGLTVMGIGAVSSAVTGLTGLLLANPIGLALAAIAGGAYLIYRNWEGISAWFSEKWGQVKAGFGVAWEGIKSLVSNYTAPGLIYKHWDGISNWFADKWLAVRTRFALAWSGIKSMLSSDYSPSTLIYSVWQGIGAWFGGLSGEVVQGFVDIWSGVAAEISTWPAKMLETGKQMIASLISGLKGGDLSGTLERVHQDALKTLPNGGRGVGVRMGGDIAAGLAQGVAGGKTGVEAAGRDIMDYLKSAAEDEAEIKSPSKVFMRIGQFLSEGLAIGVRDNAGAAISEMQSLTSQLSSEADKSADVLGSFRTGALSVFKSVLSGSQSFKGALGQVLGGWGNSLLDKGLGGLFDAVWPFAKGGVVGGGQVMAYASGGVVDQPTTFPMRGGTGLMGEAGPEAIIPLSRGPDGKLGVRSAGGGGGGGTTVHLTYAPVIDARGDDPGKIARLEAQQNSFAQQLPQLIHRTLKQGQNRRLNNAWQAS